LPIFSLEKICAPLLTAANLTACAALITIEVEELKGTGRLDVLAGIRKVLESCIRQDRDVLLPSMSADEKEDIFFIVAFTPPEGLAAVTQRINERLKDFDNLGVGKPLITVAKPPEPCGQLNDQHVGKITADIERAVQLHSQRKGYLL
jgi:hypothetical protein